MTTQISHLIAAVFGLIIGIAAAYLFLVGPNAPSMPDNRGTYYETVFTQEDKPPPAREPLRVESCLVTAYAPLDPKAKEGMCFTGDRTIGANGKKVIPYTTVAAPRDIPFGTIVTIEGFLQEFIVGDRGGKIKNGRLDICMLTQREALNFGKQTRTVTYYKNN